jgi:hypothetical protein
MTIGGDMAPSVPPKVNAPGSVPASTLQLLETKVTDMETKWTDIIQRLVDERQAQNVKKDD